MLAGAAGGVPRVPAFREDGHVPYDGMVFGGDALLLAGVRSAPRLVRELQISRRTPG